MLHPSCKRTDCDANAPVYWRSSYPIVLYQLVRAPGCCDVDQCTLVLIDYIIHASFYDNGITGEKNPNCKMCLLGDFIKRTAEEEGG